VVAAVIRKLTINLIAAALGLALYVALWWRDRR
jgi:hypothetical protein